MSKAFISNLRDLKLPALFSGFLLAALTVATAGEPAAQLSGNGSDTADLVAGGIPVRADFQKLSALATADGLRVDSTESGGGALRLKAATIRRGEEVRADLPNSGTISSDQGLVKFSRPGLTEEYSSDTDGVRQDFIVHSRPDGIGELGIDLGISGATASMTPRGCTLTLGGSSRELVYGKLHVTDAKGRVLPASLRVTAPDRIAIQVQDSGAEYPVRIDPTFSDADWVAIGHGLAGVNGWVKHMAYGGGSLYVAGDFTAAGNVLAEKIARWDGTSWSALGSGIQGEVFAMHVVGSRLWVAGNFTSAGGVPAKNIAYWDGAAWHAGGSGMNGAVRALESKNGVLYVGGDFTTAGGLPATFIALWNGASWAPLSKSPNDRVRNLKFVGNDLYALVELPDTGDGVTSGLARWNGSTWSALGNWTKPSWGSVQCLETDGANLFVGGNFRFTIANNVFLQNFAKWDGTSWSTLGEGHRGEIRKMVMHGGSLHTAGSHAGVIRWDGSQWTGVGGYVDGVLTTVASGGGRLYLGGSLSSVSGHAVNGFAQYDGTSWSPMGGSAIDGAFSKVIPRGSDLYVCGSIERIGNIEVNGLAKWNGSTWSALGMTPGSTMHDMEFFGEDLIMAGYFKNIAGVDTAYVLKFDGTKWTDIGLGLRWPSFRHLATSGGNLYAAGNFTTAGGHSFGVAKWNGEAWVEVGTGAGFDISALESSGDALYAVGWRESADGVKSQNLLKWDGVSWEAIGEGINGQVSDIAVDGQNVYVSCTMWDPVAYSPLLKWDGTAWHEMIHSASGFHEPRILTLLARGGSLYVGGMFSTLEGVPGTRNIAEWDGSQWLAVGSGLDGQVMDLVASSDSGDLIVAGGFSTAGCTVSPRIVRAENLLVPRAISIADEKGLIKDGAANPLAFGARTIGQPVTRTFTVTNLLDSPITLAPVARTGPHAADFTVAGAEGKTILPEESSTFTITFVPRAKGARFASIAISGTHAGSLPFDIPVTGTGVAVIPLSPEIDVRQPATTPLVDAKSKRSFGKAVVGKKGEVKTFVIRNTGTAVLSGIKVAFAGKHRKDFILLTTPKTSLAPGASTTFRLRFHPNAKGLRTAALSIKSNDANENPFDIILSGKATAAKK